MAADLKLLKPHTASENLSIDELSDFYRRALRGRVCRAHGRGARISEPDTSGDISISGCCEEFIREACRSLN